jgi:MFS transporter, DHA1 family, tetracycline resistance protein
VSESEQGQLQGANNSVASIAGVLSPLFFGWVYSVSVGGEAWVHLPGLAFFIASLVLALAALVGWRTSGRSAQ